MKVEYAEETSVRKSLSFEVEAEVVERELDSRAREYARKLKLPGFRAGKVPAAVVRQRFRGQVYEEAAEAIVNRVVFPELEGRGLKPVASPKVTELKIDDAVPMTFKVVFETLPLVELPEWRGLAAKRPAAQVQDEQLEAELQALREKHARFDPVEGRPAAAGDWAVVDLRWRPVEGGKGGHDENALIELGGDTHAALQGAIVGLQPGETRRVSYAPSSEPGEAQREVDCTLTLKAVKARLLPAADDDFAKDLGEHETLADLRASLRQRLLAAEERRLDRELKQALVAQLSQRASFEVPEALVERHMNARTEQAARALALQGVDPTKAGLDWTKFREAQREEARAAAKADVLLDELARREGVQVPDGEVEAELQRYARALKRPLEIVRAQMEKEGELQALRTRLREERTLDLLKANARLENE